MNLELLKTISNRDPDSESSGRLSIAAFREELRQLSGQLKQLCTRARDLEQVTGQLIELTTTFCNHDSRGPGDGGDGR